MRRSGFGQPGQINPEEGVQTQNAQAPGRQLELAERAQENMTRLLGQSLLPNSNAEPAFVPKACDHRFRHP